MELIDDINKAYDENSEDLKPHNDQLAGKIREEKLINKILTPDMQNTFNEINHALLTSDLKYWRNGERVPSKCASHIVMRGAPDRLGERPTL